MKLSGMSITKKGFATFLGLLLVAKPMVSKLSEAPGLVVKKQEIATSTAPSYTDWKKVRSQEGKCSAAFPKNPDHLRQKLPMKEGGKELKYNVYVADHDRKAVYMVLIAEYPGVVNEEYAVKNLEHFLNTLLAQNSKNKLMYANLMKVQGFPGMDFFISTEQIYFKGRAIQANNTLYLLAMECEIPNYQEGNYDYFIGSFELHPN
jgi:hypothetical protein